MNHSYSINKYTLIDICVFYSGGVTASDDQNLDVTDVKKLPMVSCHWHQSQSLKRMRPIRNRPRKMSSLVSEKSLFSLVNFIKKLAVESASLSCILFP